MRESYLAVAGHIRRELEQIKAVVDRAQEIWNDVDLDRPADHRIDAVALNLHGLYAGLERILKTIADRIDQTVPEGGSWRPNYTTKMIEEREAPECTGAARLSSGTNWLSALGADPTHKRKRLFSGYPLAHSRGAPSLASRSRPMIRVQL
ncbi:hypothetical protein [Salinibacter ruber]|uniref:ribonuclease toxin HepT-like protein n=1 Tax=Salinibacter ruber TaxID=146919 RepID=UPI002168CD47|nr:hypothetical protein [Salinibacter ruber]